MWSQAGSNTSLVSDILQSTNNWYHIVTVIRYCQENQFLRKQVETIQLGFWYTFHPTTFTVSYILSCTQIMLKWECLNSGEVLSSSVIKCSDMVLRYPAIMHRGNTCVNESYTPLTNIQQSLMANVIYKDFQFPNRGNLPSQSL